MSNAWYLIIVPNMNKITTFFSAISQQTLKIYEEIAIITQIWHTVKFYFMWISSLLYLIMIPNMKTIHPAIWHGGMHEDGLTRQTYMCRRMDGLMDWTRSYMPWFHYCGLGNNKTNRIMTDMPIKCNCVWRISKSCMCFAKLHPTYFPEWLPLWWSV